MIYIYIRFIFKMTNRIMTKSKEQAKQQTYIIIIIIAKVGDNCMNECSLNR